MKNHENLNKLIEFYNEDLNKNLEQNERMPGNFYYKPIILKNLPNVSNSMIEIEPYTDLEKAYDEVNFINGNIKYAQIKGKTLIDKMLFGYVFLSKLSTSTDFELNKTIFKPFIDFCKLNVLDKHLATEKDNFMGYSFLKFIKNKDGNYFKEIETHAGYELKMYSICAVVPPSIIDCSVADETKIKELYNISWS